ncbi:PepSY-associated TM helix domain-containing protein [Tropicibacter naphthalenivorans]|uniref:Putative iron-regulated membrane protein n=1 Tax=Tropicibacter naphthalenivorans TaxID=441103 RepID=A0A0P1GIR6_9RHOB|nr:PepSY-associated TM helix domain-containing protein [Tropicibacter naphthalenivorans]CUH75427.1 putative iron-regulated membrane protein [Tropicibacter naphthalenivorans]SMC44517.1 Uncharacterized iron-regulated membrane protein [Tropicibacter naphthalenivorans]
MLRKTVFWAHLVAGFVAGVFVLIMAVTGALLTFEAQIEDMAIAQTVMVPEGAAPLTADDILTAANASAGQTLVIPREAGDVVKLQAGRQATSLNPYTGEALAGAPGVASFFGAVEGLHRWLSASGRSDTGSFLVDTSNLIFLFLVASGLYLWLPKTWRWAKVKLNLLFRRNLPNAQARDYNWHHVFGIWALVPLFVIVLTGVIMSYSWANALLYAAAGEEPPQGRPRAPSVMTADMQATFIEGQPMSYAALVAVATEQRPDWRRAAIALPSEEAAYVQVTMDAGNGVQSAYQTQLVMDRVTGDVVAARTGSAASLGARLRMWARFAHTGQYYGIIGQTIAGLASLAAAILVYTGLALGVRRLSRMWRRRQSQMA